MNQNLSVDKSDFHMKDFAVGLTLKQRRTANSEITYSVEYAFEYAVFTKFLKRFSP